MRRLTADEADEYLSTVDLKIDPADRIAEISGRPFHASEWIHRAAPRDALSLYCFSHYVLRWLRSGAWFIVQVNDSTNLNADEDFLFTRLLLGVQADSGLLRESRTFIFDIDESDPSKERWLLGNVIHLMLLFSHHCQIVSAASVAGQQLSVQDGYVYFLSRDASDKVRAAELLAEFDTAPFPEPSWNAYL